MRALVRHSKGDRPLAVVPNEPDLVHGVRKDLHHLPHVVLGLCLLALDVVQGCKEFLPKVTRLTGEVCEALDYR